MNIFVLAFIPLIIYAFVNTKRAFLLYVILKPILNPNINFLNIPGIPLLSLELVMNLIFIAIVIIQNRKSCEEGFPFKIGFAVSIISIIISTVFTTIPFVGSFARALREIINNFVFVILLWKLITNENDIRYLVKGFVIAFLLINLYGLFERFNGFVNPIMEYQLSLNPDNPFDNSYGSEDRMGLGRVQSVIFHAIGLGLYQGLLIVLLLYIIAKRDISLGYSDFSLYLFIGLCLLILFFTNSRSPLVFFFIALSSFFQFAKKMVFPLVIASVLLFFVWEYVSPYLENIFGLIDLNNSEAKGSTPEMRADQLIVAFSFFLESPIVGLGMKIVDEIIVADVGLLGAESIWFLLMIEQGIVGILAYIVLIANMLIWAIKLRNPTLIFLIIAWLVVNTITSTPGMGFSFFCTILFLIYRISIVNKNEN